MKNILEFIKKILKSFVAHDATTYAAQASFFIIIASIPFIMLLLTLIQLIPDITVENVVHSLQGVTPPNFHEYESAIINALSVRSPATVLSITAISALWSASNGINSVAIGLNKIYECSDKKGIVMKRCICVFHTLIFALACVAALVILVMGDALEALLLSYIPVIRQYEETFKKLFGEANLLSLLLLFLCFTGFYTWLPGSARKWYCQIPGALFTVIGWGLFSSLFSIYFTHFSNFSYMYGSLTAIVLIMLWVYFGFIILFIGAELNHEFEKSRALQNTVLNKK